MQRLDLIGEGPGRLDGCMKRGSIRDLQKLGQADTGLLDVLPPLVGIQQQHIFLAGPRSIYTNTVQWLLCCAAAQSFVLAWTGFTCMSHAVQAWKVCTSKGNLYKHDDLPKKAWASHGTFYQRFSMGLVLQDKHLSSPLKATLR